jgi:hypothetical protein
MTPEEYFIGLIESDLAVPTIAHMLCGFLSFNNVANCEISTGLGFSYNTDTLVLRLLRFEYVYNLIRSEESEDWVPTFTPELVSRTPLFSK